MSVRYSRLCPYTHIAKGVDCSQPVGPLQPSSASYFVLEVIFYPNFYLFILYYILIEFPFLDLPEIP